MPRPPFDYAQYVQVYLETYDAGGTYADLFERLPHAQGRHNRNHAVAGSVTNTLRRNGIMLPPLKKASYNRSKDKAAELIARFEEDQARLKRKSLPWESRKKL